MLKLLKIGSHLQMLTKTRPIMSTVGATSMLIINNCHFRAQCMKQKKSLPYKAVPLTTSFINPGNNESHNIEGCIAMFLICHCAITNCDQMVDMVKHNISNCKAIDDVKMHRAMSRNIITNALCHHL